MVLTFTGGARQELTGADEIGVGVLVDPVPPHDELVAEIADVAIGPPKQVSPSLSKMRNTSSREPLRAEAVVASAVVSMRHA